MQYKLLHEYFERMAMTKNEIYSVCDVLQYYFHIFIIFVVSDGESKVYRSPSM